VVQEHTVAIAVDGPLTTVRVKQVFRNVHLSLAQGCSSQRSATDR
jgi:hypothetical protein